MGEWKECKIGDVIKFGNGKVRPNSIGKIPVYGGNGILSFCDEANYENETIIIGRVGAYCGAVYYENKPIWVSDNALAAKPKEKFNAKFLFYLLKNLELNQFAEGSSHPLVTQSLLNSIDVLITDDESEQRAIASVLSSLDDKIDLLHRENQTLEQIAETLFRQWFVEEASDDWEEILLNDIYMFDKGFEPGSRNYLENKEADSIRFIRVGDMLDLKASTYIKKEPGQITCGKKDLLVSFDGTIGRVSFGLEGAYSSGIRKVYSLNPVYNSLGLKYLLFTSREIQDVIKSHSSGTVIAHAGSSIDYLTFRFPKKNRLQEFNQITDPMFFKITKNLDQIETLEKLRNNLLPKLISGEVRVKI